MTEESNNHDNGVKFRVRSWLSGFSNEMRKKSNVTVQKWVDSIAVAQEDKFNCDRNELNINEPSTSSHCSVNVGGSLGVKGKLTEICNKFYVNEKLLKNKKIDLKNLIAKTSQKIIVVKKESAMDESQELVENMDDNVDELSSQQKETSDKSDNENVEHIITDNDKDDINDNEKKSDKKIDDEDDAETDNKLVVQRCHISVLGRSSSENPNPPVRNRKRLNDIGRSFSVANDNELPIDDSTDNLIYDADDVSIAIPTSLNTSPSVLSNKTNSNNQLDKNLAPSLRPSLGQMRPLREHTVSEGHYSPHVLPKNPLLRDSSFQSDSSHCSSVESLLEARKPDAESILVNLGFGPAQGSDDLLSKIPKRFLKPSQVKGVDTDTFLKNQQLAMNIHESSVLGYRGLLGNPHVPPSDIVRSIMHRFSQNEMQRMASMENISTQRTFKGVAHTILAQRQFMK